MGSRILGWILGLLLAFILLWSAIAAAAPFVAAGVVGWLYVKSYQVRHQHRRRNITPRS